MMAALDIQARLPMGNNNNMRAIGKQTGGYGNEKIPA